MLRKIKYHHIALALILVWGAVLRLYDLGGQSLWMDESYSAIAASRIMETGVPLLKSGVLYWRGLTHTYLVAGLHYLFGGSAEVLRLPAALFGIGTILLTYWAGIVFFKKRSIGLIAAALVAFGIFDIAWSRQIRMYSELQFFFLLSVTLFSYLMQAKKSGLLKWLFVLIATLITMATHLLGIFLIPAYIIILWLNKTPLAVKKKYFLLAVLVSTAILAGILYKNSLWVFISEFLKQAHFYLPNYFAFLGLNHTLVMLTALIGGCFVIHQKERRAQMPGLIFLIILIPISLTHQIAMRYIFFAIPLLYMLSAYALVNFLKYRKGLSLKILMLFLVLSLTFQNSFTLLPQNRYFLEYDPYSSYPKLDYTPQPDFKKAYAFLENQSQKDDLFIVAHTAVHEFYMPGSNFYWLGFHFGSDLTGPNYAIKEYDGYLVDAYTGTGIIDDLEILKGLMAENQGYVIWDYFSIDNRLDKNIRHFIENNAELIFSDRANSQLPWTQIWIYKFS